MKKKIILVVLIIILIVIILGKFLFSTSEMIIGEMEIEESESFSESNNESIISKSGKYTSFNIEELDTGFFNKIDEVFVKNEDVVSENTKILKVSNSDISGTIYSTISGKFYIEENSVKDKYYIYDLKNVGIEIEVDELQSEKIKLGQKAQITFEAISDVFEGKVCYISKIPVDGNLKVKVLIDYNEKIKFGCVGRVRIDTNSQIDENIKEFDIKNSFKKIGKLKLNVKNSSNESESVDFEELLKQYQNMNNFGNELLENFDEDALGFDVEEISQYYSDYWNEYWKNYYQEYQTFQVVEPDEDCVDGLDEITIGGVEE